MSIGFASEALPWPDLAEPRSASIGTSLVRGPYCQLGVGLCDADAFRAAEEGAWVSSKPDLQGGTEFCLLRVHVGLLQRKRLKKAQKVDPLEIKSGPLEGPVLAPSL